MRPTHHPEDRELPELPEPTTDPTALVESYEAWISRYLDLSMGALAAWIDRWAVDGEPDENGDAPNGLPVTWWVRWVPYRVGGERHTFEVDGRTHLELFHKVSAPLSCTRTLRWRRARTI